MEDELAEENSGGGKWPEGSFGNPGGKSEHLSLGCGGDECDREDQDGPKAWNCH